MGTLGYNIQILHMKMSNLKYFSVTFRCCTGLPNKVCPRLRDSACWRSGEITQPRTRFIREPCNLDISYVFLESTNILEHCNVFGFLGTRHVLTYPMFKGTVGRTDSGARRSRNLLLRRGQRMLAAAAQKRRDSGCCLSVSRVGLADRKQPRHKPKGQFGELVRFS